MAFVDHKGRYVFTGKCVCVGGGGGGGGREPQRGRSPEKY